MIRLEAINGKNIWDILKLRVSENQRPFVASNDISIIEAYIAQNENGHAFPFGIYDDETPVGFCMIGYGVDDSWTDAPEVAKDNYNIWRLMIDERFQGKGFGKEAMGRILDFIKTEPCGSAEKCWLSYDPENTTAQKLYHRFGFQETGDLDENEIIATLDLQEPIIIQSRNENIASDSYAYNHMIVDDVFSCLSEGRNCLILSERVKHVQKLAGLIQKRWTDVFTLIGGQSSSESNTQLQKLRSAPHDQPVVVCATGKYIGEGFDESRLDTLFLTMPISWEGILAQYAGRLHRLYDGKSEVRVYDYIDDQAVMLERMYNKRLRSYASLGYRVCGERSDTYLNRDVIYDQKTFIEPFLQDIRNARHSVIIVSPFIKSGRVHWLLHTIRENFHPLKTTVVTRPSDSFQGKSSTNVFEAIQCLSESNVNVICKNAIHQKFAIIDQKIVWYGSINLLSFGSSQESIIRIVTGTVAETLLKSVLDEVSSLRKEQTHA